MNLLICIPKSDMINQNEEQLLSEIRKRILQEYTFDLCFKRMHPGINTCCNKQHRIAEFACTYKIKCPNCEKYVPAKRFTDHLERCVKKYEK